MYLTVISMRMSWAKFILVSIYRESLNRSKKMTFVFIFAVIVYVINEIECPYL